MPMQSRIVLEQKHTATGTTIFLVSVNDEHIQHLIKLAQDPELVDLMGWDPFFELDQMDLFIEAISCYALPYSRASQPLVFGLCLTPDELPIGYVVLKGINPELHTAEVGLAVLEQRYRSRGYGRLGLQRIVGYAFDELGLKRIGAAILASNQSSINMCTKTGFGVRELLPNSWTMPNGDLADMVWMEIEHPDRDP